MSIIRLAVAFPCPSGRLDMHTKLSMQACDCYTCIRHCIISSLINGFFFPDFTHLLHSGSVTEVCSYTSTGCQQIRGNLLLVTTKILLTACTCHSIHVPIFPRSYTNIDKLDLIQNFLPPSAID